MTCSVFERQGSTLASSVVCDETIIKINILSQSQGHPRLREELKELRDRSAFRSLQGK